MEETANNFHKKPLVLVVDDIKKNLQVVGTTLMEEGYEISMANHGEKALKLLSKITPDLILLDIMMPDMNGYEVCRKIKEDMRLKDIPIIFLTAKTELGDIVKGFQLGAVDYVTKPFKKEELLARIKTHLEVKFSREIIQQNAKEIAQYNIKLELMNKELTEANAKKKELLDLLHSELQLAADYVGSLLPAPIENEDVNAIWKFVPSAELSGDSFGYEWLDEDHFSMYLLDVCGHGIGSALLSVSALNVIKFKTLPDTDFRYPEQVLKSLNKSFQMIDHNDIYFTIWYAVYNRMTGEIRHASAGHHAAVLINGSGEVNELISNNHLIGLMPETEYSSDVFKLQGKSRMFIFSDGAFEVTKPDGRMWTKEEMIKHLATESIDNNEELENLHKYIIDLHGSEMLEDDFSIMKVSFGA